MRRGARRRSAASGAKPAVNDAPSKQPQKVEPKPAATGKKDVKADVNKKPEPEPVAIKKITAAELDEGWNRVIPDRVSHVALYDYKRESDGTANYALGSAVANIITAAAPTAKPAGGQGGGRALGTGSFLNSGGAAAGGDKIGTWTALGPLEGHGAGDRPVAAANRPETGNRATPGRRAGPPSAVGKEPEAASGASSAKETKTKPKIARTDFIVLFIWKEPTPSDERRGK